MSTNLISTNPVVGQANQPKAKTPKALSKEAVGARLREIRRQKKLTLKALSQACGVPVSTLSKTELGQAALNYDKLMAISFALGIEMPALLYVTGQSDTTSTSSSASALGGKALKGDLMQPEDYTTEHYQHKFLFNEISGKNMTPLYVTIFARKVSDFSDFVRHPGQEFVMVLSGAVRIAFEDGNVIDLNEYETAYFDSAVGHVYLSLSTEPAQVVAVCSDRP